MSTSAEKLAVDRDRPFELGTESRFPLDLTANVPAQWEAYESALRETWDPEDESLWIDFDPSGFSESDRSAGALVWSHRVWVEYPAIAESEAVLIRACLEPGIEIDLKYCLAMRAVERARSADLCQILAGRLHHYEPAPAGAELMALLDGELVRRALHADGDLDAYIATHLAAGATIDLRMWERAGAHATPAIERLIGLVTRDKARMAEVAWRRLGDALPDLDEPRRLSVAESVTSGLIEEEFKGRQVPALLAKGIDRTRLLEAHERAAASDLGGIPADEQLDVVATATSEVASRLGEMGVSLNLPAIAAT